MKCRFCQALVEDSFCNLGKTPLSNSYVHPDDLHKNHPSYPLHAFVCRRCLLVQVAEFERPETIFSDYSYFSSYSDSWLNHAKSYVQKMVAQFDIHSKSQVVEIASNDGYLLQYFKELHIPVLGVEPAKNVALAAEKKGIPTLVDFFGVDLAARLKKKAHLIVANNVLAHVPRLNDFVAGFKILLAPTGIATLEFPHLFNLIYENQFDTIYHEHFSYFSFHTAETLFSRHGMVIFDVERIPTHGGSLRIFVAHKEDRSKKISSQVFDIKRFENEKGLCDLNTYLTFDLKAQQIKNHFLQILNKLKREGKQMAAYGAPAKGNTLLNYCGIRTDLISYTVDRSPHKQGKYLPGSLIPIYPPEKIKETKPHYLVILPWNLREEIIDQMQCIRDWGGQFIIPIPNPILLP